MYRSLTGTPRDVVLLVARVLLAFVIVAHTWMKMSAGLFATAGLFSTFGIPLAIAAASFTIVVELVVTASLVLGLRMVVPAALMTFVLLGAIYFVHGKNGMAAANNGWEFVAVIICGLLVVACAGPGRISLDHVLARAKERRLESAMPARFAV